MSALIMMWHNLQSWAPVGMGKRGHLSPSGNVVFLCISTFSNYSKTPSKRIIYALFHNLSLAYGGLHLQTPTGDLSLDAAGRLWDFRPQTNNLPTPG